MFQHKWYNRLSNSHTSLINIIVITKYFCNLLITQCALTGKHLFYRQRIRKRAKTLNFKAINILHDFDIFVSSPITVSNCINNRLTYHRYWIKPITFSAHRLIYTFGFLRYKRSHYNQQIFDQSIFNKNTTFFGSFFSMRYKRPINFPIVQCLIIFVITFKCHPSNYGMGQMSARSITKEN